MLTKLPPAKQPFLALSKSATSPRAAADLIQRATSAPNTYIFAELLHAPQLQTLASSSPELRPHIALLRLFSYGDYATYAAAPNDDLPPLNDAQRLKLRQLSLLSLAASGDRANLGYDRLQRALGLDSAQELEMLVTTAIYAGLLEAKLDPARGRVQVARVAPLRDLAPGEAGALLRALQSWSARCTTMLDEVETNMTTVLATARTRVKTEEAARLKMKKAIADAQHAEAKKLGGSAAGANTTGGGGSMVGGREQLTRRAASKRSMVEAAVAAGAAKGTPAAADEIMDLDVPPFSAEESKKRASKRKM